MREWQTALTKERDGTETDAREKLHINYLAAPQLKGVQEKALQ